MGNAGTTPSYLFNHAFPLTSAESQLLMQKPINVLHITPHLGGGVGKALSGLVCQAAESGQGVTHKIVCLEQPEKLQFVNIIRSCGCSVYLSPSEQELSLLVAEADIVQLEFWNHPAIPKMLSSVTLPAHRLLVWCHVSGLHTPKIPEGMLCVAHRFLFTSSCSYEAPEIVLLKESVKANLGVVSSGTIDGIPSIPHRLTGSFRVGYVGSLNFSKLHPDFVKFLSAVRIPGFTVKVYGDPVTSAILKQQCNEVGRPELLDLCGYSEDIYKEFAKLDVLIYLLNPEHYGTAENALLEAMAMGIVPIVLNNPAEMQIVEHKKTGIIIESPEELADAIDWLVANPEEREKISEQASIEIRSRYTAIEMERKMNEEYKDLIKVTKKFFKYSSIFGKKPYEWFMSFQRNNTIITEQEFSNIADLKEINCLEKTKGSLFHFAKLIE